MYHHRDYGVSFPVVLVGISKIKRGEGHTIISVWHIVTCGGWGLVGRGGICTVIVVVPCYLWWWVGISSKEKRGEGDVPSFVVTLLVITLPITIVVVVAVIIVTTLSLVEVEVVEVVVVSSSSLLLLLCCCCRRWSWWSWWLFHCCCCCICHWWRSGWSLWWLLGCGGGGCSCGCGGSGCVTCGWLIEHGPSRDTCIIYFLNNQMLTCPVSSTGWCVVI